MRRDRRAVIGAMRLAVAGGAVLLHSMSTNPAAALTASPTPTMTGMQIGGSTPTFTPTPPGSLRVRVGLQEFSCEGAYAGAVVVLEPWGFERLSDEQGFATFTALRADDYTLRLEPPCVFGSCWDDLPVTVGDGEVSVDFCPPVCSEQVHLTPTSALPGTEVTVEGACQEIHSGRFADLFFGPIRVGSVRGETAGDFRQTFTVPHVPAGTYTVETAGGSALFNVTGTSPACPGDCDGDRQVAISELVRSVGVALQTVAAPTCPVFASGAGIADLVRAVRAALDGCAALLLPSPTPGPDAGLCNDCCAHCQSAGCVEECYRRDGCLLAAQMVGWVRDSSSGLPIAGATVTLNGIAATAAADGSYEVYAERNETCALDYLFELEVSAAGYETYRINMYRPPFPIGGSEFTFQLVPVGAPPGGLSSMYAGQIY